MVNPADLKSNLKLELSRLTSLSFEATKPFEAGKISLDNQNLTCKVRCNLSDRSIAVYFQYKVEPMQNRQSIFKFSASFYGLFYYDESTVESDRQLFCKANAAAIIFPSFRASIASATLATGYPPLTLPIINFFRFPVDVVEE